MHVGDGIDIEVVAEKQCSRGTALRLGIQSGTAAELGDVIDGVKHDDGIAIEAGGLGGRFHFLDMIGRDLGRHQMSDPDQPGPGFLQPTKFEEFMEDIENLRSRLDGQDADLLADLFRRSLDGQYRQVIDVLQFAFAVAGLRETERLFASRDNGPTKYESHHRDWQQTSKHHTRLLGSRKQFSVRFRIISSGSHQVPRKLWISKSYEGEGILDRGKANAKSISR